MTLHERIRERRVLLGLSKAEVIRRVGISRQAYTLIERGSSTPSIVTLQAIAAALGTSVGALLGETDLAGENEVRFATLAYRIDNLMEHIRKLQTIAAQVEAEVILAEALAVMPAERANARAAQPVTREVR